MYYYKARFYDTQTGRFLQTDPIGYEDQMNLYGYVGNDPVNAWDPSGEDTANCTTVGDRVRCDPIERDDQRDNVVLDGKKIWVAPKGQNIGLNPGKVREVIHNYQQSKIVDNWVLEVLNPVKRGRTGRRRSGRKPRGKCCFVAGTLVQTDDGLRPIEDIEIGALVLSRDEETGDTAFKPVIDLSQRNDRKIWEVTIETNKQKIENFRTTYDHPWRIASNQWLRTLDLAPGMKILTADQDLAKVIEINQTTEIQVTYNLEVADFHTYFVGNSKLWVHNNNCTTPDQDSTQFNQVADKGRGRQQTQMNKKDGSIWQRDRATNSGSGGHGGSAWKRWPNRRSFERGDKPQTIRADGSVR